MANSKLIVVEGAQGAGKTTITDYIRNTLSYTNLYRLCGTADQSKEGYNKAVEMYENLITYIEGLQNKSINLLFDRTFFTEEIYCRLGKKDYKFTDEYEKLVARLNNMDFDIYYITLYLEDTSNFNKRLDRGEKAKYNRSEFDVENSISQQNEYLKMADEIHANYKNIKVYKIKNDKELSLTQKELREIIGY